MTVEEILTELKKKAAADPLFLEKLLRTREQPNALSEFCRISTEAGYPLYEMDLIDAGEAAYAAMKRSTNGGGENSPALEYQEDYYEMFLADLASLKNRKRQDVT